MGRKLFLLMIFLMIINPNVYAADSVKIGIVDFREFMKGSIAGKAVQEKIRQRREQLKIELNKEKAGIQELQKRYKREAPLWDKKKKEEKKRQFQARLVDFRILKEKKEKEFKQFRFKLIAELEADVLDYAEKIATEKGYRLIIEKQSGRVLYFHSTMNVTDELIRGHDALKRNKK